MMKATRSVLIACVAVFAAIALLMTSNANATRGDDNGQGNLGVIDIYHLVDILVLTDEYGQERIAFEEASAAKIGGLEEQFLNIRTQMSTMSQDDPQAAGLYQQYQAVSQQLDQETKRINGEYQVLLANQIGRAYQLIHENANVIAAKEGFAWVFATRRGNELVQTTTLQGVTQEILARPVVTPPNAADLTEIVRGHMGLPTLEEVTAKAEATAAARQAALEAAQQQQQDAPAETPAP